MWQLRRLARGAGRFARRLMWRLRRLPRGVGRFARRLRWDLVAGLVGVLVLVAALLMVIVYLPPLAIDPRGLSRTDWLTHVESLRATVLQGLGGLALLGTLYFSARTLRLNRRGQLTDRFGKAIEQLGSDSLAVRLGGIYALEQIAFDSAELHWPTMEVLTAYLREHGPARADADVGADAAKRRLPADHQAIATVIGRRRFEQDPSNERLDLRATDLSAVRWDKAHLAQADLRGVCLERAYLVGARLEGALLNQAHMARADLNRANLDGAHLREADLRRAVLAYARLDEADLRSAHLEQADVSNACLTRASLSHANLLETNLRDADLREAIGLTVRQLRSTASIAQARLSASIAWQLIEPS